MKRLSFLFVALSIILIGCSESESKSEQEQAIELTDEVITPEVAEETAQHIQTNAIEQGVVQDVLLNEKEDAIYVTVEFTESSTDEEKNEFLFNYFLFLEDAYPNQEIEIEKLIHFIAQE